jgi:putative transposase
MKRSKFTDSQIMDALKRVDLGLAVPDATAPEGLDRSKSLNNWRTP